MMAGRLSDPHFFVFALTIVTLGQSSWLTPTLHMAVGLSLGMAVGSGGSVGATGEGAVGGLGGTGATGGGWTGGLYS
jgi:hypothetical protein